MRKKLLTLTIAVTIMLTGCGSRNDETTELATTTGVPSASDDTTSTPEETNKKTLDGLCSYLLDNGLVSGEATEPMYQLIGAINGVKYLDSHVEIYEYDITSDFYKSIVDTNEISGIKISAINGPYVLLFSNDNLNSDVIDAFNNY